MNFIALDVETAIGKRWSICQIGLAIVEKGKIISTISKLVQPPQNEYNHWNINVHGITPEMTINEPLFPKIWNEIYPLIRNKSLVAHNAPFDINCLQQTLEYYNLPIPDFKCACTYAQTGKKLDIACKEFDIELTNHHDAASDAVACAEVFLKILKGAEPNSSVQQTHQKDTNYESPFKGHERLSGDLLKPNLDQADPNNPFYSKKIVFTGVLNSISRKEAAVQVKNMGADIDTGISKRTNFVITGSAPGPSKMNKIKKYNNSGSNIQILNEDEFLGMIK